MFGETNLERIWGAAEGLMTATDPAQGIWQAYSELGPYFDGQLPTQAMKKTMADWREAVTALGQFNPSSPDYKKPPARAEKKVSQVHLQTIAAGMRVSF